MVELNFAIFIIDKSFKKYLQYSLVHDTIMNGSLVKRLRRRPLTAETRVRFPYGLLIIKGPIALCADGAFIILRLKNSDLQTAF